MQLEQSVKSQIEGLIGEHRVVLFMKGTKSFPQCGFSSAVVNILKEVGVPFQTANVLADPALREGIKVFSDWPTIPQLYVDQQFVGGCDIIREMHASGELAALLGVKVEPPKAPTIHVSESAAKAFRAAEEPGDDKLRVEIDASFRVELYFGPKQPNDLVVQAGGLTILVDAATAKRADGLRIDFVDAPGGGGFAIENPNAPPSVKQLSARDAKALLEAEPGALLVDVRGPDERALASVGGAIALDDAGRAKLDALDKTAPVAFLCHHGVRSLAAAEHYLKAGYRRVYSVAGGIDAWSREVDASIPRY
jgi:monothiol glutaredoxin